MYINAVYKNIDQELSKILPVDLVKTISEYYCYKAEHNPIQIYDKVLASINILGHDGYDSFGPESDLSYQNHHPLGRRLLEHRNIIVTFNREVMFCYSIG
uniref:Uncharacterized protein n=1 Tax=viral metagenome TaxID=1070528 RepID=A0A6C0JT50_9ZZZZ